MKKVMLPFMLLFFLAVPLLYSQRVSDASENDELLRNEKERYAVRERSLRTAAAPQRIDIIYYRLNIRIADQSGFLRGDVTATAGVLDSVGSITFDVTAAMTVDSVFVNSFRTTFVRNGSTVTLLLPEAARAGDTVETHVYYHGYPPFTGLGSYSDVLRNDGNRWIYTLSEPYGARDWWPCIDHPNEKADSVDIIITCANGYTAVSNGLLAGTHVNGDNTVTSVWKHRYPVSSYLIAVSIGKYSSYSDWYRYSAVDSMEIVNFVLSDIASYSPSYRENSALTVKMLDRFSTLFGPYPFLKEKYGHVQFGWGGGMEHQTLTSLGSSAFSEATIAHELVHQWFGDLITCRTWKDLWLNEGFAQYFEAVWREQQYGTAAYWTRINSRLSSAKGAVGTLFVQDTANVGNLFASSRVYNKGASVLHMLRKVLGDSLFFAAVKMYANDPLLKYGTAETADFRLWCESVAGRDLNWFFQQWIYGEKYPKYTYSHSSTPAGNGQFFSTVRISQSTGTTNPKFFVMPVDLKFTATNWDTTVTVWNDSLVQTFSILMPRQTVSVQLDPQQWILRDATFSPTGIFPEERLPQSEKFSLLQNYPNPFNASTTIGFTVPKKGFVRLKVFNTLGQTVAEPLKEELLAGDYSVRFDADKLPSGLYFYRIESENFAATKTMLLLK